MVPVFKNVGERSNTKNDDPVSLLSVVSKVFEKLVNNRIIDHLEKCGIFSDFKYSFRSSHSTADLLTVVSDRIARAFNKPGATRAVALDISKTSDRVWHVGLLHKLKSYGISCQKFGLISSFLSEKKRVLEAAKLAYPSKTKESITSQKLGSRDFSRIAKSVLNKGKSAIPPLLNSPEVLSSEYDKAKLLMTRVSL